MVGGGAGTPGGQTQTAAGPKVNQSSPEKESTNGVILVVRPDRLGFCEQGLRGSNRGSCGGWPSRPAAPNLAPDAPASSASPCLDRFGFNRPALGGWGGRGGRPA